MSALGPLFVSSDCALGGRGGDVDDGFAVAALLAAGAPIHALASCHGNTDEATAWRCLGELVELLCPGAGAPPLLRGAVAPLTTARRAAAPGGRADDAPSAAAQAMAAAPRGTRVLALGPLTDVAAALALAPRPAWSEVVVVTGDSRRGPHLRPLGSSDLNRRRDAAAAARLLAADVPLTIVPLDVARRLRAGPRQLALLPGPVGEHLRRGAARWVRRARWRWLGAAFPVWDLVASLWVLRPGLFLATALPVAASGEGRWRFGVIGGRAATVLRGFDATEAWRAFVDQLGAAPRPGRTAG